MSDCNSKKQYTVAFPGSRYAPLSVEHEANLSRKLTASNSPILFGCRSGICGTCLSEVTNVHEGTISPPSDHERDLLDVIAQGNPRARLACQIELTASISITPLEEE